MNKILVFIIGMIMLCSMVSAVEHYYEIPLKYNKGDISSDPVTVKPLGPGEEIDNMQGGYVAETVDFNGERLNVTFFSIPLIILYDNFDEETGKAISGGMIVLEKQNLTLKLQYFENAKEVNIYDMNITKKTTIDVSMYAKDAGIEITEGEEAEKATAITKPVMKTKSFVPWIVLIITTIMLVMIVKYIYKKRKQ